MKTAGPNTARGILENSLDDYRAVINAIRSYHQHTAAGSPLYVVQELMGYVGKNSRGGLGCGTSGLFSIDSVRWERTHEKHAPFREGSNAFGDIRGFWFLLEDVAVVECAILDGGITGERFSGLSQSGRQQLTKNFSENRRRGSMIYAGNTGKLPLSYSAFVTEIAGGYEIETFVPVRFFDERLFYRSR